MYIVFHHTFADAQLLRDVSLRQALDPLHRKDHAAPLGQSGQQALDDPPLFARCQNAFDARRFIYDEVLRAFRKVLETNDRGAAQLIAPQVARGLHEIGAGARDMIDTGQRGKAAIGVLHDVVDIARRHAQTAQRSPHRRLFGHDMAGNPTDDGGRGTGHGAISCPRPLGCDCENLVTMRPPR